MGSANCSGCNYSCGEESTVEIKEILKKSRQNSLLNKNVSSE